MKSQTIIEENDSQILYFMNHGSDFSPMFTSHELTLLVMLLLHYKIFP